MVPHLVRVAVLAVTLPAVVYAALPTAATQHAAGVRVPKQIHTNAAVVDTAEDHNAAETHFGGGEAHGHGKYFMDTIMVQTGPKQLEFGHVCENPHEWEQRYERQDQDNKRFQGKHVPHKDHYEFGYRRGNEHHFKERYEKAHPHHGQFKTKARWGDKHGGYGEHYWDYNHAGHHGDDGGSSDDEGGDGSDPVPDYQHHQQADVQDDRVKREHEITKKESIPLPPVSSLRPRPSHQEDNSASASTTSGLNLAYDEESGTLVNEATGQRFLLTPIN